MQKVDKSGQMWTAELSRPYNGERRVSKDLPMNKNHYGMSYQSFPFV